MTLKKQRQIIDQVEKVYAEKGYPVEVDTEGRYYKEVHVLFKDDRSSISVGFLLRDVKGAMQLRSYVSNRGITFFTSKDEY